MVEVLFWVMVAGVVLSPLILRLALHLKTNGRVRYISWDDAWEEIRAELKARRLIRQVREEQSQAGDDR